MPSPKKARAPIINRRSLPGKLTGRQHDFVDEFFANQQNGAAAYRKAYKSKMSSGTCSAKAQQLLAHPAVAKIVKSRLRMQELARQNRLEQQQLTEERIIDALSALAFFDPRSIISWGPGGKALITMSKDLTAEACYAIREITVLKGGIKFKFHDRHAALMDLARIRGMVTDKSASFHFHEDLAKMSPEEQKKRVAELLEFAASLKVSGGDDIIDVTPEEEEGEDGV